MTPRIWALRGAIPLTLASVSPYHSDSWLAELHLSQLISDECPCLPAGDCLLDQPSKPISLPEDLPGASYSLSQQCELAFGVGSKPCPYMQYCTKLWCTGKAKGQMVCQTRHFPWADGTSCGEGKFCLKGTCVERHNLNKFRVSVLELRERERVDSEASSGNKFAVWPYLYHIAALCLCLPFCGPITFLTLIW